jgi:hypothetical protein
LPFLVLYNFLQRQSLGLERAYFGLCKDILNLDVHVRVDNSDADNFHLTISPLHSPKYILASNEPLLWASSGNKEYGKFGKGHELIFI